jgi:hypothetical protein
LVGNFSRSNFVRACRLTCSNHKNPQLQLQQQEVSLSFHIAQQN